MKNRQTETTHFLSLPHDVVINIIVNRYFLEDRYNKTGLADMLALKNTNKQLHDWLDKSYKSFIRNIKYVLGGNHNFCLLPNGRLFGWGENNCSVLGDGTTNNHSKPIEITHRMPRDAGKAIQIDTSSMHTHCLTDTAQLLSWGNNKLGQLGDGTQISCVQPVDITHHLPSNAGQITLLSTGRDFSMCCTDQRRIFSWGSNDNGQLGCGTKTECLIPTEITQHFPTSINRITHLHAGSWHAICLTDDHRLFCWGRNSDGKLGDGSIINRITPVEITNQLPSECGRISQISAGIHHSGLVTDSNHHFAWGNNDCGQLGNGSRTYSLVPAESHLPSLPPPDRINRISSTGNHTVCCTTSGRIFSWGGNPYGQLGNGSREDSLIPVEITAQFPSDAGRIIDIQAGFHHTLCCTDQGSVFSWGLNLFGQLGDGTTESRSTPVEITAHLRHCFFGRDAKSNPDKPLHDTRQGDKHENTPH